MCGFFLTFSLLFGNSSFFPVRPISFFSNKSRILRFKLPCNCVTAVLKNCSTSKKLSLQKCKDVFYLCSSFVSAILIASNLFQNKSCKMLLPSISKALRLSSPSEDEPALLLVLDKHTRKWSKIDVQSSKLTPSTQVFETKTDSVSESSLWDDSMALVQSTCDRDTFAHVLCTVFCCETLCVPRKLVNYGTVGSRSVIT